MPNNIANKLGVSAETQAEIENFLYAIAGVEGDVSRGTHRKVHGRGGRGIRFLRCRHSDRVTGRQKGESHRANALWLYCLARWYLALAPPFQLVNEPAPNIIIAISCCTYR